MASPVKTIDDEVDEPRAKPEVPPEVSEAIEYVDRPPEELDCSVCLQVLSDPTLTSCCGQHFCRECIDRVIAKGRVCPLCNEKGFQTFLDKAALRKVRELKVYCTLKSRGCGWVGELGALDRHLDVENGNCGFVTVECEFGVIGCVGKMLHKDLECHGREYIHKHLLLMSRWSLKTIDNFQEKSREQCVHFEEGLAQQRMDYDKKIGELRAEHEEKSVQERADYERKLSQQSSDFSEKVKQVCLDSQQQQEKLQVEFEKQRKMDLEQLKFEFQQKLELKDQHFEEQLLQKEKQFADLQVKFERQSKENSAKLKEVEQKYELLRKNSAEQFDSKMKIKYQQIDELKRKDEELEKSLDTQLKQTSERVEEVEKQLLTFISPPDFTMTNFAKHKKDADQHWYSPSFYSHLRGYKICVRVDANGGGSGKRTHVSVYVHLMRGEFDDHLKWPFRGGITVQLLNQRGEEGHEVMTVHFNDDTPDTAAGRVVGCERAVAGHGYSKFTPHSELGYNATKNTKYLANDCLKFRVSNVKLTHPQYT